MIRYSLDHDVVFFVFQPLYFLLEATTVTKPKMECRQVDIDVVQHECNSHNRLGVQYFWKQKVSCDTVNSKLGEVEVFLFD